MEGFLYLVLYPNQILQLGGGLLLPPLPHPPALPFRIYASPHLTIQRAAPASSSSSPLNPASQPASQLAYRFRNREFRVNIVIYYKYIDCI